MPNLGNAGQWASWQIHLPHPPFTAPSVANPTRSQWEPKKWLPPHRPVQGQSPSFCASFPQTSQHGTEWGEALPYISQRWAEMPWELTGRAGVLSAHSQNPSVVGKCWSSLAESKQVLLERSIQLDWKAHKGSMTFLSHRITPNSLWSRLVTTDYFG